MTPRFGGLDFGAFGQFEKMSLVFERGVGPDDESFRPTGQVIDGEEVDLGPLGENSGIGSWWEMEPERFVER